MPELQEDSDDDEPQPRRTRTTITAHTRSVEQESTTSNITQPGISRPVRTRKAPERLNLAARVEQFTTLVHMTAKKAMKEYPTEAEPAIIEACCVWATQEARRKRKA